MSYVVDSQIDLQIEDLTKKIKNLKEHQALLGDPVLRLKSLDSKVQKIFFESIYKINSESSSIPEGIEKYQSVANYLSKCLFNVKEMVVSEKDSLQASIVSINKEISENEKFLENLSNLKQNISLKEEELKNESNTKDKKRKTGQKPLKTRDIRNYDQDSDK